MQVPSILQGDSLKRLLQGAFIGFLATVIVGFGWGGWTLGSTAKELAEKSASSAAIAALAPICVDKFQRAAGAEAKFCLNCGKSIPKVSRFCPNCGQAQP